MSTGIFTSFKQYAKTVAGELGYFPNVEGTSNKPEGVFARAGDTKKQQEFGFRHTITFEEGIKRAITFFEKEVK